MSNSQRRVIGWTCILLAVVLVPSLIDLNYLGSELMPVNGVSYPMALFGGVLLPIALLAIAIFLTRKPPQAP